MKNFYSSPSRVFFLWIILFSFTLASGQNISVSSQVNSASNGLAPRVFDKNAAAKISSLDLVQQNQSLNISPIEAMKGKPEDLAKRDAFSKHFKNSDGSYTAVIASGPVHYQKNGQWTDIDTKISKTGNGVYGYSNTANLLESYFGNTAQKGVLSKTSKGEVKEFLNTKMYWEVNGQKAGEIAGADVAAKIDGNQLFYNNLFGNISAEFTILTGKRKLNYIIPNKEALGKIPNNADYLVFSEDIELPTGWNYVVDAKQNIILKNEVGKEIFTYPPPTVSEEYGSDKPALPLKNQPVSFVLHSNRKFLTVLLKVKTDWLFLSERKFPLGIDPTVVVVPNNAFGWTGWASASGGNNDDVISGYYSDGYSMAGFMRFNLSGIPDNSLITSVTSNLYYYYGRNGNLNGRRMAITDINADPLTTPLYANVWNSLTQYISSDYVTWTNGTQGTSAWMTNNFSTEGVSYIQDALSKDFVTVAAYPYQAATWNADNYAWFRGYSNPNRPQLVINYSATPVCTIPSSSANTYFINNVQFLGSLIGNTTSGNTGYNPTGYYSSPTNMATQIPGGVVNVYVSNNAVSNFTKAWVDWNKNGIFDSTEKVYDSGQILIPNTTFGFVVPVGTALGTYKIRIRNYHDSPYFGACGPLSNGETEDYAFTVIADCAAKITAVNVNPGDGKRCGLGAVVLSASGTGTSYQWYTSQFSNTPIPGETGSTYTTGVLPIGTTTFYVTAKNGSPCESVYKTPVKAVVSPTPTITFSQSSPDICGTASSLSVSSSGDKEEVTLFNEGFGSSLGLFTNQITGNANANAVWQQRPSPYVLTTPPYYALKPALSSGYNNGSFAMISTDVNQTSNILNNLVLTNNVNTTGFLNLKLDFDLFYYSMIDSDVTYGYLKVDYSINGGTAWTNLTTITTDLGSPSLWSNQSIALPAVCLNQPNFKIRFSVFAYGANNGWIADLASIDNVRLYGDKPLSTNFAWTGGAGSIYNSDCTTPYSGAATAVCIKPSALQIENDASWNFTATATLSNGCSASGTITVTNNTKTWNTAANNWGTNNWKPGGTGVPPIADKCVIVKTPVTILALTDAFAKNVRVESTGKLNINTDASLTVTDAFVNQATEADVVIASDASLKQITDNPTPPNLGSVTAKRNITLSAERQQYNYLISPLENQTLASIYKDISGNPVTVPFVLYHSEATNKFYTSTGAYIKGRALAVKEPGTGFAPGTITSTFAGPVTNGAFTFGIVNSNVTNTNQGFNLTGNPYPSNIDLRKLYDINGGKTDPTQVTSPNISATFYFWDNTGNTIFTQQGSSYLGQSYAIFNVLTGSNGSGTKANSGSKVPTKTVKVGQGFMTRSLLASYNLNFNNSIRTTAASAVDFFGKGESTVQDDRYWLKMTAPSGITSTIVIVHYPAGNNLFGAEDSRSMGSSDVIYSMAEDEKLAIDGRSSLVNTDIIPLGTQHFAEGNYVIAIDSAEGIFANGQSIYLKDKQTGIITNLSQGTYTFAANAGESTGRFEIIYQPETVLSTDSTVKETFLIYRNGSEFVVRSSGQNITDLQLFDASGRLILQRKGSQKELRFPAQQLSEGMFVVKATLKSGEILTRKIRK